MEQRHIFNSYKTYLILVIIASISMYFRFAYHNSGRLSPDSITYLQMSNPNSFCFTNLFPVGYPTLIYSLGTLFSDAYINTKIIGFLCYFGIIGMAYFKKFYFVPTCLLMLSNSLLTIYATTWSEVLFLCLLYFTIYQIYQIIHKAEKKHLYILSFLLFSLFITRYSGLFIIMGCLISALIFRNKTMLRAICFTLFLCSIYLCVNYIIYGTFFGKRIAPPLSSLSLTQNILQNLMAFFQEFNPLLAILESGNPVINYLNTLFNFSLAVLCIWFIYPKIKVNIWYQYLTVILMVYLLLIMITGFKTVLDPLNFRLLSPFKMLFWFIVLIECCKTERLKVALSYTSCVSIIFLWIATSKNPTNFILQRQKIKHQIEQLNTQHQGIIILMPPQKKIQFQQEILIRSIYPNISISDEQQINSTKKTVPYHLISFDF
jgi:hypothetical protein